MSKETLDWLSHNTLIGFTAKRGNAWHHRAGDDNHYAGAVPLADVERCLFDWEAEERPLYVKGAPGVDSHGNLFEGTLQEIPGRKVIVRSDNGHVMGIFTDGYQPHQYRAWLLDNVATILDDTLQIGSAGLLKGGAVAWVSVEVPDNIITPEGVVFRPGLLARTSFDGSLSTTYGRHITAVVCDNTLGVAAGEHGGQQVKVRHSSKSLSRIASIREALGIVYDTADAFATEVARLTAVKVDDRLFEQVVDSLVPLPEPNGKNKRGITLASSKRDKLWTLWQEDARVTPWSGTAYGAWQAFSTYGQHEAIVRGASRQERNMLNAVNGSTEKEDLHTVERIMALAV